MRQLSSDVREFIDLLNTKNVRYVIVGAWALAFHRRPRYTRDLNILRKETYERNRTPGIPPQAHPCL